MVEPEIVRHGLELSKWSLSRVVVFDKTGCKIIDQDQGWPATDPAARLTGRRSIYDKRSTCISKLGSATGSDMVLINPSATWLLLSSLFFNTRHLPVRETLQPSSPRGTVEKL